MCDHTVHIIFIKEAKKNFMRLFPHCGAYVRQLWMGGAVLDMAGVPGTSAEALVAIL